MPHGPTHACCCHHHRVHHAWCPCHARHLSHHHHLLLLLLLLHEHPLTQGGLHAHLGGVA
jgi:hypothetical protein